jgi:ABC-type sulfate/molybdate transport systems ATPase subunit
MPLEVHIEKTLAEFTLDVAFQAEDAPLGILGPSGAGKTMLLRCIAGLEQPNRGRIALGGRTLLDTGRGIRVPARKRRIGMLFQHYALFPHRSVRDNVGFSLRQLPAAERDRRLRLMLERVHAAELEPRYPRQLSGGEQQRVALARAFVTRPAVLFADEPTGNLDATTGARVGELFFELNEHSHTTLVLVTHEQGLASRCARTLRMDAGRVL